MPPDPRRVKELFHAALDLPDPADRPAFLDRACGDDAELRARLDELLAAHDRPAEALGRPLVDDPGRTADLPGDGPDPTLAATGHPAGAEGPSVTAAGPTADLRPEGPAPVVGTVIAGRYKVRQEIGEGGMGSVYLAEQTRPIRRQVALKLIKAGMDSRTVLARFESERQALALMDHPNIARVLDAGTTEHGRPFFVMDLVKGVPLTDYCDAHRLDLPSRLAVFRQVCSAVQHAHQKGVIHRDLKPTNILVEAHDGHAVPKVIDFGLAKATSGLPLTDQSLFTAFGSVAGTPLYMAPEQATFNAIDVDTRADIYALGVILYELLTGSTPIRRETLRRAALDALLRMIREEEPPTPSQRISTSEGLPGIAATRHIEPAKLGRYVRGDLDWIVMKALAKDRSRRYESATALARDVERFVTHEPVSAGPPSSWYRTRKFVRRHRGRVVAASLVLLALVGGIVGTSLGLARAGRERDRAERRSVQNAVMVRILGSIFQDLNPGGYEQDGRPLSALLGERLQLAAAEIEGEAVGDPLAVARMQTILGKSLRGLGYPEQAIGLYTKARATFADRLGPDHPDTLACINELSNANIDAGNYELGASLTEECYRRRKAVLDADHPDMLQSLHNLAVMHYSRGDNHLAVPLFEQCFARQKVVLGVDHPRTLVTQFNLASILSLGWGSPDRALSLCEDGYQRRKIKLGAGHPDTLKGMAQLAGMYGEVGQKERSVRMTEECLSICRAKLGEDHPLTIDTLSGLAYIYQGAGHPDRALALQEEAYAKQKAKLGPDHPITLGALKFLADVHDGAGQAGRALALYEECYEKQKTVLGAGDRTMLRTLETLADAYRKAGQTKRVLPLYEECYERQKAKLGADHPERLLTLNRLANAYKKAGQPGRVLALFEECHVLQAAKLGADHPLTIESLSNIANANDLVGQHGKALSLFEECHALRKAKLGADHPDTLKSLSKLADAYGKAGQAARALSLQREYLSLNEESYEKLKAKLGADAPDTLAALMRLTAACDTLGSSERALQLREEIYALRKAKLGADSLFTIQSLNSLAVAYDRAGQLGRALRLHEEIYALRKAKLGADHPDTLLSLGNLISANMTNGDFNRAESLLIEFSEIRKRKLGAESGEHAEDLTDIGHNRLLLGKWSEAEPALRDALALHEKVHPDDWLTSHTRSLLGGVLLGRGMAPEAGPLLRGGYEGLKQRAGTIDAFNQPRIGEALDRLIEWAEASGKPDEAKAWKDEKAKLPTAAASVIKPKVVRP